MAVLKKLPQINCVMLIMKLHSSSAHHYAFSDHVSWVYVVSSAKVACKYFSGKQEIWKMDRIIFFIFSLYSKSEGIETHAFD